MDKNLLYKFGKVLGIDHDFVWVKKNPATSRFYIEYILSSDKIKHCEENYWSISSFTEPPLSLDEFEGCMFKCEEVTCNGTCKIGDLVCPKGLYDTPLDICCKYRLSFIYNIDMSKVTKITEEDLLDFKFPVNMSLQDFIKAMKEMSDFFIYE